MKPTIPTTGSKNQTTSNLVVYLLISSLAFACISSLLRFDTWPSNHENKMFFLRTMIYADHISAGDFFPVWSSVDNSGYGSPILLLYHKLYYYVAGTIQHLTGDVRTSTITSIWLFLTIGGVSMYRLALHLSKNTFLSASAAFILVMANYTTTNWLVRGAMAELSAAMLVPAVMYFFFMVAFTKSEKTRYPILLGLAMAMTFLGHSVLAFYLTIILGGSFLSIHAFQKNKLSNNTVMNLLKSGAVFFVILAPFLAAMAWLGADYDMERIVSYGNYHPKHQYRDFSAFFRGAYHFFGKKWLDLTVQVDLPVLALICYGVFRSFALAKKEKSRITFSAQEKALMTALGICVFLLSRHSLGFYEFFPGAKFIQFPWRLLAVVTPTMIALSILFIGRLSLKERYASMVTCLAASAILSGGFAKIEYGQIQNNYSQYPGSLSFSANNEYVPVSKTEIDPSLQLKPISKNCTISRTSPHNSKDTLESHYSFSCEKEGPAILPQFASKFHRATILDSKNAVLLETTCGFADTFQCMVTLPVCQKCTLRVRNPTLTAMFTAKLIEPLSE